MLMFNTHIAFACGLIALVLGGFLLIWSKVHANLGTIFAKTIAYLVIIIAVFNLLCTSYYMMKYWSENRFDKACPMMAKCQMMKDQMMQRQMMKCPMMSGQMMQNENMQMMPMKDQMNSTSSPEVQQQAPNNSVEHTEHH